MVTSYPWPDPGYGYYYGYGYAEPYAPQAPYACGTWIWRPDSRTYLWQPCRAPGAPVAPPAPVAPEAPVAGL